MSNQFAPYEQKPPPFYEEPPRSSGSGCWLGALIGCLGVIVVSVLLCAGGVWYVQQNASKWVAGLFREVIVAGVQNSEIPEGEKTEVIAQIDRVIDAVKQGRLKGEDLEPVLKNVVGGDVEVALRDTSTPLNVDVNTERIERLLVNLASYGRGRIPAGGRLRIELGTSVVDRHFSAKHPNVRLGLHALITVTETGLSKGDDAEPSQPRRRKAARSGVDFATLQSLVSDCGGHLWMNVHPLGEMVAKIRLPLSSPQEQRAPRAITSRASRERQAAGRWFQT